LKQKIVSKQQNNGERKMANKLKITRIYQDDCTVGILNYHGFRCCTLELPDKDNHPNISCIPAGRYQCKKIVSPSLGKCVEIENVLNRTYVRLHSGNYTSQILGCVLVGDSIKDINRDGILDVTNSKNTLNDLMALLPESFELEIS
jgi:hypothetical protein